MRGFPFDFTHIRSDFLRPIYLSAWTLECSSFFERTQGWAEVPVKRGSCLGRRSLPGFWGPNVDFRPSGYDAPRHHPKKDAILRHHYIRQSSYACRWISYAGRTQAGLVRRQLLPFSVNGLRETPRVIAAELPGLGSPPTSLFLLAAHEEVRPGPDTALSKSGGRGTPVANPFCPTATLHRQ